jgi:anthranilate 1,2-dioxygenase ferredoxin reductase subunit
VNKARADYDILIVGGGQAARRAAEGARVVASGFSIAILGEEPHAPYERPPLSKAVLESGGDFAGCEVRTHDSYGEAGIDLLLGRRARSVDRAARRVLTEDGDALGYGRLILATGSRAKRLDVPADIAGQVFVLRTRADAAGLASWLTPGARVAIIGAGFIGLEVASSALARGAKPAVLEAGDRALSRALPAEVSDRIVALHRAAGVEVRLGVRITGLSPAEHGGVAIATADGSIAADVVVIGIGVTPNVELAQAAGLAVDDGIVVGADGSTADPHIFAAGEVTRHPVNGAAGSLRLESWQVAELQAEAVGRTAAGAPTAHDAVPWFWSDQLGHNLQVLGHAPVGAALVHRDLGQGASAWFALEEGGRLAGVISLDAGREIAVARRLMAKDARIAPDDLADPAKPLRQFLA